jgi:hypothetical protein
MSWRAYTEKRLPWWLQTGEGGLVKRAIDSLLDAASERAYQGLLARFPSHAPDDAIPRMCRDRRVMRGINEPRVSINARLVRSVDDHRIQGGHWALHDQLRAYLQADVMIRTVDRRGNWYTTAVGGAHSKEINKQNWVWDGGALSSWSRFWVIIYPTGGAPWSPSVAGAWPAGGTIGTTATPDQVASVRSLIREWQPDGTRCEWIIVAFDPASFNPAAPVPDGTWEHFGYDDAGNYYVARLESARYWKGVDGA